MSFVARAEQQAHPTHNKHAQTLITRPDDEAAIEAKAHAAHRALCVCQPVPTDQVRSVPHGDECVGATDGDVSAARALRHRET